VYGARTIRWAVVGTASTLVVLATVGCGTRHGTPAAASGSHGSTHPPAPPVADDSPLPNGWKWESFRDVELAVPSPWADQNSTSQLTTQWCIRSRNDHPERLRPEVGRPGASTLVGCALDDPDVGYLIANAGKFVAFEDAPKAHAGTTHRGDRTIVTVGGVRVLVQLEPRVAARVIATIHVVAADSNGCRPAHPISTDPSRRPRPAIAVAELRGVTAVSACRYTLREPLAPDEVTGLFSSIRLDGAPAARSIARIAGSQLGSGPNTPQNCARAGRFGDDAIVLLITSDAGMSQVFLRYSGCVLHGFDDGTSYRTLTKESVAPFIAGQNQPQSANGGPMAHIIL
jgi:hypothetical protein